MSRNRPPKRTRQPWYVPPAGVPSKSQAALAGAAGLISAGAFAPFDFWPLALVGLIPLFYLAYGLGPRQALVLGYLFGLASELVKMHWLMVVFTTYGGMSWALSLVPYLIFAGYLAVYPAFFASILAYVRRAGLSPVICAPFIWAGLEWVREVVFTGVPWLPLGNALAAAPALVQTAEWWSVTGVSALAVLVNALAAKAMLAPFKGRSLGRRELAAGLCAVILVVGGWVWGQHRMEQVQMLAASAPRLWVSVIQGDVGLRVLWNPKHRKANIKRHVRLTQKASAQVQGRPWLVIWPESAAPFYFLNDARDSLPVLREAEKEQAFILLGSMGSMMRDGRPRPTNRVWLVGPGGRAKGFYDKVHLVPFGEYVPLEKLLFFVRALAVISENFEPGIQGHTLKAGPATLGPLICYESIFPQLARSQCARGADLIVNQTNDAWFGRTGASAQHMSHLVLRCVENRRACARAGNTGVSGFIDPDGRVFQKNRPVYRGGTKRAGCRF